MPPKPKTSSTNNDNKQPQPNNKKNNNNNNNNAKKPQTHPPQLQLPPQSQQPSATLTRFREDRLLGEYMALENEYAEIQRHNFDPATIIIERESLRGIDPNHEYEISSVSSDEEGCGDNGMGDGGLSQMEILQQMMMGVGLHPADDDDDRKKNSSPNGGAPQIPTKSTTKPRVQLKMKLSGNDDDKGKQQQVKPDATSATTIKPKLLSLPPPTLDQLPARPSLLKLDPTSSTPTTPSTTTTSAIATTTTNNDEDFDAEFPQVS